MVRIVMIGFVKLHYISGSVNRISANVFSSFIISFFLKKMTLRLITFCLLVFLYSCVDEKNRSRLVSGCLEPIFVLKASADSTVIINTATESDSVMGMAIRLQWDYYSDHSAGTKNNPIINTNTPGRNGFEDSILFISLKDRTVDYGQYFKGDSSRMDFRYTLERADSSDFFHEIHNKCWNHEHMYPFKLGDHSWISAPVYLDMEDFRIKYNADAPSLSYPDMWQEFHMWFDKKIAFDEAKEISLNFTFSDGRVLAIKRCNCEN
jgi:hypothetical protein